MYSILKAIHIVFVVSYFVGIFYLVRLFVYYKDAEEKPEIERNILQKQYKFMIKRLWNIITLPAAVIVFLSGIALIVLNPILLSTSWFHIKITLLLLLASTHFFIWKKIQLTQNDQLKSSSLQLRMFNELATVFLVLIVFVVMLKDYLFEIYPQLIVGFIAFFVLMFSVVKLVNRNKK